nr:MAG TPA: hypothetical protein [Caudoviricetes sp.]
MVNKCRRRCLFGGIFFYRFMGLIGQRAFGQNKHEKV